MTPPPFMGPLAGLSRQARERLSALEATRDAAAWRRAWDYFVAECGVRAVRDVTDGNVASLLDHVVFGLGLRAATADSYLRVVRGALERHGRATVVGPLTRAMQSRARAHAPPTTGPQRARGEVLDVDKLIDNVAALPTTPGSTVTAREAMANLRLRCVILERLSTFNRASDSAQISLADVAVAKNPADGRTAVRVRTLDGKPSRAARAAGARRATRGKIVYVPFVGNSAARCPATAIVELAARVRALPQAAGDGHPRLYVALSRSRQGDGTYAHAPLGAERIARLCTDLIKSTGAHPTLTSHSMRGTAASLALARGEAEVDVLRVGDWASIDTLKRHYSYLPPATSTAGVVVAGASAARDPSRSAQRRAQAALRK